MLSVWRRLYKLLSFPARVWPVRRGLGRSSRCWHSSQTGGDPMGRRKVLGLMLSVALLVGLWAVPTALADEKPQKGGVLRVALAGDPPSLDMHQESTFLVDIPMSTVYNTLVMY